MIAMLKVLSDGAKAWIPAHSNWNSMQDEFKNDDTPLVGLQYEVDEQGHEILVAVETLE